MTSLKRIMAVVLAVMLIASIGLVSFSAAGETLTIKGKQDFEFDVYKVASFKGETAGGYNVDSAADASVKTFIETPGEKVNGKTFLETLDAASSWGTKVATLKSGSLQYVTGEAGIYYVKFTQYTGDGESEVTKNSVIVWPEYSNGDWDYMQDDGTYTVDLASKTSSEYVTKYFAEDTNLTIGSKTVAQGDVVNFVLEANVVGAADKKVTKFEIWDKMCPGLQYNNDAKVYYDSVSGTAADSDFTVTNTAITTDTAYAGQAADTQYNGGTFFKISAKSNVLAGTAFYGHQKVFVTYSATVKNTAKTGSAGNPNKDGLIYSYGTDDEPVDGRDVTVFTASVKAKKINGTDDSPLEGAEFGLYQGSDLIAVGTSDTSGNIVFKKNANDTESIKLGNGTYKVAEISAPAGFAKTTATYEFTVNDNYAKTGTAIFEAKDADKTGIANYPTKLPETGGAGTTMFFIIGGCLVLLAGAMFVIIMKKKASSK